MSSKFLRVLGFLALAAIIAVASCNAYIHSGVKTRPAVADN